jgi:hypothetical protein
MNKGGPEVQELFRIASAAVATASLSVVFTLHYNHSVIVATPSGIARSPPPLFVVAVAVGVGEALDTRGVVAKAVAELLLRTITVDMVWAVVDTQVLLAATGTLAAGVLTATPTLAPTVESALAPTPRLTSGVPAVAVAEVLCAG